MKLRRKLLLSSFLSLALVSNFGVSAYADATNQTNNVTLTPITQSQDQITPLASSTYGPFYVRPEKTGDHGGFIVELDSNQSIFVLKDYKVYGLHSGQKASIQWTFSDFSTGKVLLTKTIGDVTSATDYAISNLPQGGSIQVSWRSLNNNEVVGGTFVSVYGYAYQ